MARTLLYDPGMVGCSACWCELPRRVRPARARRARRRSRPDAPARLGRQVALIDD